MISLTLKLFVNASAITTEVSLNDPSRILIVIVEDVILNRAFILTAITSSMSLFIVFNNDIDLLKLSCSRLFTGFEIDGIVQGSEKCSCLNMQLLFVGWLYLKPFSRKSWQFCRDTKLCLSKLQFYLNHVFERLEFLPGRFVSCGNVLFGFVN